MASEKTTIIIAVSLTLFWQSAVRAPAADNDRPRSAIAAKSVGSREATESEVPATWNFQGVVVDEADAPVPHATVSFHASYFESRVETAVDGRFSLSGKASGNFVLIARSASGDRQAFRIRPLSETNGDRVDPIRFVLTKARDLEVTVTDSSKRPIAEAQVGATRDGILFDVVGTDAAGKAHLRLPAGLSIREVFAFKADVGVDSVFYAPPNVKSDPPDLLAADDNRTLTFELSGARLVKVHVNDPSHKPIEGIRVSSEVLSLPNRRRAPFYPWDDRFRPKTDAMGVATLHFVPSAQPYLKFYVQTGSRSVATELVLTHKSTSKSEATLEAEATVYPRQHVVGTVLSASGHAVGGATITVGAMSYEFDPFRWSVISDESGAFEFWLAPRTYCTFEARHDRSVAPCQIRLLRSGTAVEPLKFVLQPATRLHGRVTRLKDKAPVANARVSLKLKERNNYENLPADEQLPNPKKIRRWIGSPWFQNTQTGADGQYEFLVAPGQYLVSIIGFFNERPQEVEISDAKPVIVDLVDSRPDQSPLRGRVVFKNDLTRGVAGATVDVISNGHAWQQLKGVADREGKFEVTRSHVAKVVCAHSGALSGAVKISPEDQTVTVPLAPTASATGTLMDELTGLPAAKRQIDYGVRLPENESSFAWYFGGRGTTDSDGRIEFKNLTAGLQYELNAVIERDGDLLPSWYTVKKLIAKPGEQIDLGKFNLPLSPYTPPSLEQLVDRAMSVKTPYDSRLDADLHEARLFDNRVLVFAASPKSVVCRRFFSILHARDSQDADEQARAVLGDFTLLAIDTSARERLGELKTFLARWIVTPPMIDEAIIAVLDREGHLIAATTNKQLWPGKTMDAQPLTEFLKKHAPPMPDAEKRLADALAQAKRENKRVLVEESGAWCGWCHVLAKYLDRHRPLIEKDYVWITIDSRFTHGPAVIKRLRPKSQGGIPWMAILDATGKPLITSDGPQGNIGYPTDPKDKEHFEKMLRTTAQHLSDAEIKSLLADAKRD